MIAYAMAFLAAFIFVGLRSMQQLNVVHRQYKLIIPTGYCMALVEVYLISKMASSGVGWIVFFIGSGGGLGSCCATYVHDKFINKETGK